MLEKRFCERSVHFKRGICLLFPTHDVCFILSPESAPWALRIFAQRQVLRSQSRFRPCCSLRYMLFISKTMFFFNYFFAPNYFWLWGSHLAPLILEQMMEVHLEDTCDPSQKQEIYAAPAAANLTWHLPKLSCRYLAAALPPCRKWTPGPRCIILISCRVLASPSFQNSRSKDQTLIILEESTLS